MSNSKFLLQLAFLFEYLLLLADDVISKSKDIHVLLNTHTASVYFI